MESYLSFGVWLLLLNVLFSVFIHIVACIKISFLWLILHCMITYILFIHPSVDRQLDCFRLLVIMNHPAVSIGQQRSVWVPVSNSLGYIPRSRISGSHGNSMNCQTFFQNSCTTSILTSNYQLFHIFTDTCYRIVKILSQWGWFVNINIHYSPHSAFQYITF